MSELPSPGPGRPHHESYSEPMRGVSLLQAAVIVLIVLALALALDLLT